MTFGVLGGQVALTGTALQAYHVRASHGAGVLSPMIGTILAHYRDVPKSRGRGMCVVCEAEDLRAGLGIALKLIPENLNSDVTIGHRSCVNIPRREAVPWGP